MLNPRTSVVAGCVLASLTAQAGADEDVPPVTDAPDGQYAVMRGVQGPKGMLSARIGLGVELSSGAVGEPTSIAPDIFFSVSDRLQLGVLHQGPMGWQSRPGRGLCLTGEDGGCPKLYDNLALDMMVGLAFGTTHLSARGTLFFDALDPATMHLALGLMGKAHFGTRAALVFDPKIAVAVDDRDTNPDMLYVPIELEYQAGAPTTLKLLTGISGDLGDLGDTYQVPLGVGVVQNLNRRVDLGARLSFDNLLGVQPDGVGRADLRSVMVLLNLRS